MSKTRQSIIGILISTAIAVSYSYVVGKDSRQLNNIPSFYWLVAGVHLIQLIAFIPAYLLQTQTFYDGVGSSSYVVATVFCLVIHAANGFPSAQLISTKQKIASGLIFMWAFRLGIFLVYRIIKSKEDSRFRQIKKNPFRFFMAWWVQALWVTLTAGGVFCLLTKQRKGKEQQTICNVQILGLVIWVTGFITQSLADIQKTLFNSDPSNKGKFIKSGLWGISRHPNYCGQVTIWLGVALFIFRSLEGAQNLALISPLFVYLLLTKLSGVPMLQVKANKKWGGQPQYEQYVNKVPVMFPWMSAQKYVTSNKNKAQIQKQDKKQ